MISISNLHVSLPGGDLRPIRVLRGVSISIADGEFLSVVGPSGCGKSTLLRVVAGLVLPDEPGQFAQPPEITRDPLSLSMNFQSPVLLPWLTVEQNALLPFDLIGRRAGKPELQRLEMLLHLTGLQGFRHAFPDQLPPMSD